jgi:O-methyltransferase
LIAFDSFSGLPKIGNIDKKGPFKKGDYLCSEEKFIETLKDQDLDSERVLIVKGFYKDTLNEEVQEKYGLQSARIIHIDCDLYESAKVVLDFVTPAIQEGTIIIFDDWFQFHGNPDLGEARAFREWLDKNQQFNAVEFMRRLPWSNSFILTYRLQT